MALDPARRAEIETWAAEWVERNKDHLTSLMAPDPMEKSYELGRTFLTSAGDFDVAALRAAIEAAGTDPVAFDALCWAGAGCLKHPQLYPEMPVELREFVADVLWGKRTRAGRPGRPSPLPYRDERMFHFVDEIISHFGIPPTRSSDHRDSACDFAAAAMFAARLKPNHYETLKDIWERYNRALILAQRSDPSAYPPKPKKGENPRRNSPPSQQPPG